MSIFEKFQQLAVTRQELEKSCDSFFNIVMEEIISGTEAVINGRPTILAGSNNYLGLSFDSGCIDAACDAVRKEGTGTTGSRMANGTFTGEFMGMPGNGNDVELVGNSLYRFENGKIIEAWQTYSRLKTMQQLGVLPTASE